MNLELKNGTVVEVEHGSTILHFFKNVESFNEVEDLAKQLTEENLSGAKLMEDGALFENLDAVIPESVEVRKDLAQGAITVHVYAREKTELELLKEQLKAVSNGVDAISDAMIDLSSEVYNG